MATYKRCRNCGCNENGVSILRCDSCRFIFCYECAIFDNGIFSSKFRCPRCSENDYSIIGEISSDNDISSDDEYEGLAELFEGAIESAVATALDKRERDAECRREEQLRAIERARIAEEAKRRNEHYALLDSLCALSPSGLESKLSPFNSNQNERELAIKVKVVKQSEEDSLVSFCRSMGNREPKNDWEYLNKKRFLEVREEKDKKAKQKLEQLLRQSEEARLQYIVEHPRDLICQDLAISLTKAENLRIVLDNYRGGSLDFNGLQKRFNVIQERERIEKLPWPLRMLERHFNPVCKD